LCAVTAEAYPPLVICYKAGMATSRRFAWSVLALTLWLPSCGSVTPVPVSIQESPDRFVRLEPRDRENRRETSTTLPHPLNLSTEDWERILSGIQVQSRKDTLLFTFAI